MEILLNVIKVIGNIVGIIVYGLMAIFLIRVLKDK